MAKKQNRKAAKVAAKTKGNSRNTVTVNKKHKDTVFRKLFHQKKELLELYNALNDFHYTNVVFYNGMEKQPERQILKLSDLYQPLEPEPMLELQVLVLNINKGNNEWLKARCKTLCEYMQYVERIRYYRDTMKFSLQESRECTSDVTVRS